jgi:hypothetical protein
VRLTRDAKSPSIVRLLPPPARHTRRGIFIHGALRKCQIAEMIGRISWNAKAVKRVRMTMVLTISK